MRFCNLSVPCVLGKGGIAASKREGDGATPAGTFKILYGFYREDRIRLPHTAVSMIPIHQNYGWCDDPVSPRYNRFVRLPTKWRHEQLWRNDNLYDICLVLDYNIQPRRKNRGSAIFFHLRHPEKGPTEGCVAVELNHMKKILMNCARNSQMIIHC